MVATPRMKLGPLSLDIDEAKDNFSKGVEDLKEALMVGFIRSSNRSRIHPFLLPCC